MSEPGQPAGSEPGTPPAPSPLAPIAPLAPSGLAARLADGDWHRLHPATPLLRGGFAFVAILGIVIVNLRDVGIEILLGAGEEAQRDPVTWLITNEYAGLFLLAVLGGLLLFMLGFWFSWRMHTFRITQEQVEVRSGILFRTNRRGRLDRIQGVNIVRPFLARLVGAAKLEITVAGQDGNIPLAYLASAAADELRREILTRAAGERSEAAPATAAAGGLVERRVSEFLAPELGPDVAPPESVVQMHLGRLIGSIVLSGFTLVMLAGIAVAVIFITRTGELFFLFAAVPTAIGVGGYYVSRFTRSLRYSIAATPDGVRVGFGLLSTTNETLPPGRIHAVQVSQPLLWRPFGWWEIRINRAATSSSRSAGQAATTILPVGNLDDARKVLALVLPGLVDAASVDLLERGMLGSGADEQYTVSPRRAAVLRWFSWRRNGFAFAPDAVLLRRGAVWRELIIVPQARMQSIQLHQGPILRSLRLASVSMQTVAGPVSPRLGALDDDEATEFFEAVAEAVIRSAGADTSHRWRRAPEPGTAT